ncbi:pyrophosphatase PpaX [gut metagenome]|uniref:Pyrophosphatase PpaX n=1 Tax=gut metagenome TaxID=749906 RepID=J9GGL5_9ZZZZ
MGVSEELFNFVNLKTIQSKMDIQLIIFDFDGTLSDTRQTIVQTFQATIRKLKLDSVSEEACAATIGLPLKAGFQQLYPTMDEELAERCVDTYREIFNTNKRLFVPNLFPRVRETLVELHWRGIRMGIASSRSSQSLHEFIDEMQLEGLFDCVLGVDSVAKAKPDPTPVFRTWEVIPAEPQRTLVVGDMPVDIEMGKRAGAWTAGVTYGNASAEALQAAGADFLMDDFGELCEHCFSR